MTTHEREFWEKWKARMTSDHWEEFGYDIENLLQAECKEAARRAYDNATAVLCAHKM